jgi:hypothetical protein
MSQASHAPAAAASNATPIAWTFRAWMVAEVFFGITAILTLFLRPQDTATSFAWPIKPDVMAAALGAFYLATATVLVLSFAGKSWQQVRTLVLPSVAFSTTMLIATVLHWDKFSHGTLAFYLWLASYVAPPPIFVALYLWHQRRSAPVGTVPSEPLSGGLRRYLSVNGLALVAFALVCFVAPKLLIAIAPWKVTPLTGRALCAWLLGLGAMQLWMARENDWARIRLATPVFLALPLTQAIQLARFPAEIDGSNALLWVLGLDMVLTAVLLGVRWLRR